MKTFNSLFFASLLLISAFLSPSYQESPELKEASALTESLIKLFNEQRFDEASRLAKRALEIREKLLPSTDPRIETSLIYLGDIYTMKRDYSAARETFQRLLQLQEERFGPEHVNLARTLERLAVLHFRDGSVGRAEDAYKRALALREREFGSVNGQVAQSLFALAEFYRARKNFDRAAPLYKRALSIYGQLSGVTSSEFELTSEAYTCLAHETNKLDTLKDLNEIWKRFAAPGLPAEPAEDRVLNGKALTLPKPAYPDAARERRLAGTVIVKVKIDETGRVISARDMCHGPAYLSESAVSAARLARFTPTKLSGQPVRVDGLIKYNFVRGR